MTSNGPACVVAMFVALGCGSNEPPPNHAIACDKLDACRISSSGFSCDEKRASACAECINGSPCGAILGGGCAPPCPGVTFKAK
jgi:hypothetical protein